MQGLHDVMWGRYIGESVEETVIAEAMIAFERLARRNEYLLPAGSGHLRRSAREAMTCVFGAPAVAALHCAACRQSADAFDGYWADISLTWFEHAVQQLHEWEDDPRRRRLPLAPYCSWRREDDDEHRACGTARAVGLGSRQSRGGDRHGSGEVYEAPTPPASDDLQRPLHPNPAPGPCQRTRRSRSGSG